MSSELGFGQVAVDCVDAGRLAGFWSQLVGRDVEPGASAFYARVPASEDGTFPAIIFLQVPEPKTTKNRWHLDLVAADLEAEVARAESLGAVVQSGYEEYGTKWTTLADPEGNLFDIGARH